MRKSLQTGHTCVSAVPANTSATRAPSRAMTGEALNPIATAKQTRASAQRILASAAPTFAYMVALVRHIAKRILAADR